MMLSRLPRILSALCMVSVLPLFMGGVLRAQSGAIRAQSGPNFLVTVVGLEAPMLVDAATVPALRKRVSLSLSNVTVDDALRALAVKSGIQFSYSRQFVPLADRVTVDAKGITVAAALTEILFGAGVDVVFSTSERAALVRRTIVAAPAVGSISGRVIDAITRRPVGSATIQMDRESNLGRTRDDGSFQVTQVPVGSHVLHVRVLGYLAASRTIEVGEGIVTNVEVALQKSPYPLDQVVITGPMTPTEMKAVPNAMTVITASDIERRGITRIDQLFRGEVPALYAVNSGSSALLDDVLMFSRGATAISGISAGTAFSTNPIKTYVDGVELADAQYLSQIDPRTIERIEILPGPQASTTYGSNALNGVMQIFTKRGTPGRPRVRISAISGILQNNLSSALAPSHTADGRVSGSRGIFSYDAGAAVDHMGAWTPAKKTTRFSGNGAVRMKTGHFIVDATMRVGKTRNLQHGDVRQVQTSWRESGLVQPNGTAGISDPTVSMLDGRTAGLTVQYNPFHWWSHEISVGVDRANVEIEGVEPGFITVADTLLSYSRQKEKRVSERYTTTARLPIGRIAAATVTFGADHWRTKSSFLSGSGLSIPDAIEASTSVENEPGKNSGGFIQAQLGIRDQLFVTYGLRGEWNPTYGDEAQPNYAPRYGVAYTRDVGPVTAKLRASYGRSTRPPAVRAKSNQAQTAPTIIALYGQYDSQIANSLLEPEFQRGSEGGLELYLGDRASLSITRYNQTVDNLINRVIPVDSVRSLAPSPQMADSHDDEGFGFIYVAQNLNIGTIRNDGWELTGSVNFGSFTTRGVYSWTRSRIIGVTPQYRNLLGTNILFQVGRSFDYLPEHTWSVSETMQTPRTTLAVTINGHGQIYKGRDWLANSAFTTWRDPYYKLRQNVPLNYRSLGKAHATGDFNASHRFTSDIEAIVQVRNIANYYEQDMDITLASLGRQSRAGLRVSF
jgi:outer membrane receptor protein involved in Fe transport